MPSISLSVIVVAPSTLYLIFHGPDNVSAPAVIVAIPPSSPYHILSPNPSGSLNLILGSIGATLSICTSLVLESDIFPSSFIAHAVIVVVPSFVNVNVFSLPFTISSSVVAPFRLYFICAVSDAFAFAPISYCNYYIPSIPSISCFSSYYYVWCV